MRFCVCSLDNFALPSRRRPLQTKGGCEYEGIFHTPGLSKGDTHIVLKKARKISGSDDSHELGAVVERLVIVSQELVQIKANNVPNPPVQPIASAPASACHGDLAAFFAPSAVREARPAWVSRSSPDGFSGDRDRFRGNPG